MFRAFLGYFDEKIEIGHTGDVYTDFISGLGGKSFGNGVFRSFSCENVAVWTKTVEEAYPDFKNMFRLFGFDWLGRCFAIDLREGTQGNVLLFEIGTGDVLLIPCTMEAFLNKEILQNADACLAQNFFLKWQEYSQEPVEYGDCIGYKIPLFLGGEDNLLNLEKSDMDVYWGVISQVKRQVLR